MCKPVQPATRWNLNAEILKSPLLLVWVTEKRIRTGFWDYTRDCFDTWVIRYRYGHLKCWWTIVVEDNGAVIGGIFRIMVHMTTEELERWETGVWQLTTFFWQHPLEKKLTFFMPPPFEEWWRGIKCYPCPCVRPFVLPLSKFGVRSITFERLHRFNSNLVCWYIISKHMSSSIWVTIH